MARQYHTARRQPNQAERNERTSRVYGATSRRPREDLHRRAEGDLREVPRLLERVRKSIRSGDFQLRIQARHENRNRNVK